MKKFITAALLAITATTSMASSWDQRIILTPEALSPSASQYTQDLVRWLVNNNPTYDEVDFCNSQNQIKKINSFKYDQGNSSGCHFILHASENGIFSDFYFDHTVEPTEQDRRAYAADQAANANTWSAQRRNWFNEPRRFN